MPQSEKVLKYICIIGECKKNTDLISKRNRTRITNSKRLQCNYRQVDYYRWCTESQEYAVQ